MALTFTQVAGAESVSGKIRERFYDVTFDSSYVTGGEPFTARDVGLLSVYQIIAGGGNAAAGAYHLHYDTANSKLMVFRSGGATPAGTISGNVTVVGGGVGEAIGINPDTNAGVLSKAAATNRTIPIATFLGAAPTFTGTAIGAAAFSEVANAVNLSTLTFRLRFVGI